MAKGSSNLATSIGFFSYLNFGAHKNKWSTWILPHIHNIYWGSLLHELIHVELTLLYVKSSSYAFHSWPLFQYEASANLHGEERLRETARTHPGTISLRIDSGLFSLWWSPLETLHVCFVFMQCYFDEFISIFSFIVSHMHNVLNEF